MIEPSEGLAAGRMLARHVGLTPEPVLRADMDKWSKS